MTDEPRPLREALERVSADLGMPSSHAYAAIVGAWPGLVGEMLAQHARVGGFRDGILTVEVDSGAWATELKFREAEIAERLAEVAPESPVERVVIRVRARPSET